MGLAMISSDILKEVLDYNPATGDFVWKVSIGGVRVGARAGSNHPSGYREIKIFCSVYRAHRLAWLHTHGEFPSDQIDHINGKRSDNRIINLRAASSTENNRNSKTSTRNTSGVVGVGWEVIAGRWRAYIGNENKLIRLGNFTDWFEAVCARKSAEKRLGYHPNHGRT